MATINTGYDAGTSHSPAEDSAQSRPVMSLLQDLKREAVTLFKQEVALTKREVADKAQVAVRNTAYIGAGGGVVLAGGILLLFAAAAGLFGVLLAYALPWYHALWVSPLLVGGIVAIIGAVMIQKGKKTLQSEHMAPEETIQTMRENKQWLQNEIR